MTFWKALTDKQLPAKVKFNRISAVVWLILLPFSLWLWPQSVAFVIIASVYANIKSDWGIAEAADDTKVIKLIKYVIRLLEEIKMAVTTYNLTDAVVALTQATRSANTTVNGTTVDRADTNGSVMFAVQAGTLTDGTVTVTIQESDDGSSWANAAAGDIQGAPCVFSASDDDVVKELGYNGRKRYVRVTATTAGATTGGIFGAIAVISGGRKPNVR
jgi:hypothetical protein